MWFVRNGPEQEFVSELYESTSFDWHPEERFLSCPIDRVEGNTFWYRPGLQVLSGDIKQPKETLRFFRELPEQDGFLRLCVKVDSGYRDFTTVRTEVTEMTPSARDLCRNPQLGTSIYKIPDEEQTQLDETTFLDIDELAEMETIREALKEAVDDLEKQYGVGNWERD